MDNDSKSTQNQDTLLTFSVTYIFLGISFWTFTLWSFSAFDYFFENLLDIIGITQDYSLILAFLPTIILGRLFDKLVICKVNRCNTSEKRTKIGLAISLIVFILCYLVFIYNK